MVRRLRIIRRDMWRGLEVVEEGEEREIVGMIRRRMRISGGIRGIRLVFSNRSRQVHSYSSQSTKI
jgi:hypothetical protein